MSSTTISRRSFIAAGGSLSVGFSLFGSLGGAQAATSGTLSTDSWLTVTANSGVETLTLVTVYAGRVELGTGVRTALTQIVAEELNVTMRQVAYVQGDTNLTPGSQGVTAGSKTVQLEGPPLRRAAAYAMQSLMSMAATQLGVPVSSLKASAGRIGIGAAMASARSYAQLIGAQTVALTTPAVVTTKSPTDFTLVGTSVQRADLEEKFTGRFLYSADVQVAGMLHARVMRPPGRNSTCTAASGSAAAAVPGFVSLVRQGNFVAVVAQDEFAAVQAVAAIRAANGVTWSAGPALIAQASLPTALKDPANVYTSGDELGTPIPATAGDVDAGYAAAQFKTTATYFTPFHMHGAMGSACVVADVSPTQATVWAGTQGPYPLRAAIAAMTGMALASVRVIYVEAAGCYGHNAADDVAAEAVLISILAGYKPIRLQWTRAEEHAWEPLGAAMLHEMRGGVTAGSVVAWDHKLYSPSHGSRPNSGNSAGNLLPAQHAGVLAPADMPALNTNSASRNAPITYNFPNRRLNRNWVKSYNGTISGTGAATVLKPPLPPTPTTWVLPRTTALRSLGGLSNTFANESFMDELAVLANANPLDFRLAHAVDDRTRAVLYAVKAHDIWASALPSAPAGFARGRGAAFLRYETVEAYVAMVAEVLVNLTTGAVQVTRFAVAHDCGQIINPDGLRNQIEGNVLQGISRALKEQVDYTTDAIRNNGWADNPAFGAFAYPVIQFDELPSIDAILIDHPEEVSWGAGEPTIGGVPAAIGNAIFNATGARMRTLPMRPATVLAGITSAAAERAKRVRKA